MENFSNLKIKWTDYFKYRIDLRGYNFKEIEKIIRKSPEQYFDTETRRTVVVGKHDKRLVIIPLEILNEEIIPITIHATSRQQINFRNKTGRFQNE